MIDITKIPEYILEDARQNVPFGREAYTNEELSKMSKRELFDHYLQWQDIIGYSNDLLNVIESIFQVELKD